MPEARGTGGRVGAFVRNSGYLRKWLILGISIGIIAGLGAVVFYLALDYAGQLLLGYLGGYHPPTAAGDGGRPGSAGYSRAWAIPLVTFGGALLSAIIVAKFAPEAEGHGTDSAIEAVHTDPRSIRARAVLVKMVSSALTIGSGGSAGREGPTAQISAGFGSLLARRLDLSDADGRVAVSLGIGSGIGAIFGAPLGGAVLAASIVYREDFDYRSLIPGFITSGTAYTVYGLCLGFDGLFGSVVPNYVFDPAQLGWFVLIGICAAAVGYLYARTFYATVALTKRLPGGKVLKPAVGGLLVGLLALAIPQVLSSGYGWVQFATATDSLAKIPLWIVLILPFAKILATSLSIGSGGSGGIFGPGIVIGAFVGAAIWQLADLAGLPGIPNGPGVFVVVAMMACFGSVAHAPLAVMIMVAEMTSSFSVLPGAMITVGIAYLLITRTDVSMYKSQRLNRETAAAERAGTPRKDRKYRAMTLQRSKHVASLKNGTIVAESDLGSITRVTADDLPILTGMSIKRIVLNPGAMRTPHWHANANELTYCLSGTSLVSVIDTYNKFASFTITAGEMFHIDSGSLHHIENIGEEPAEFILAFRSERPEDFGLAAAFGAMTDAVLGNTYDLPAADFAKIRRSTTDRLLAARQGDPVVPSTAHFDDPHKFNVEAQSPPVGIAVGSARLARLQYWPALKDLSMYSLRIREDGMREPHWHPITAEMGYVHEGSARMTVMNPDGTLDTWYLEQGDVYFIPRAYPHHIEVVDAPASHPQSLRSRPPGLHFAIFFDQPTPGDIGYRASASAYSREVLAATFNVHIDDLPNFPFTKTDPLIVSRNNPVDAKAMGE